MIIGTHAQWRICTAVQLKIGGASLWNVIEFKDTNDEAVWVGIQFSTIQKQKNKIELFWGGTYGLHMSSPGGTLATAGPPCLWDISYLAGAVGLVVI